MMQQDRRITGLKIVHSEKYDTRRSFKTSSKNKFSVITIECDDNSLFCICKFDDGFIGDTRAIPTYR